MDDKIEIIDLDTKEVSHVTDEVDSYLDDIESVMKKEATHRKDMIKEATNNLDRHSKKLIEYNQKLKEYEMLCVEYKKLWKKSKMQEKEIQKYIASRKQIDDEILEIKKTMVKMNKDNTALKSILQILVDKVGIDIIAASTKISADKLKKYLD